MFVVLIWLGNLPDFIVTKPAEDTWKMETVSTFKTTVVSFKVGEEFKETTADDRIVNATITFEGDYRRSCFLFLFLLSRPHARLNSTFFSQGEKMIHNQVDPNDEKKNTIIERFVDPPGSDNLVTTVKCGDIVAKRVYKKKPDPATA